jgi:glycosyltransferase involved in cell wall biosynthesis
VKLSVIIPTYNGAEKILHLLKSLQQQTVSDFETVVVIDGSTDNTLSRIKQEPLHLKDLKIIEQENKGRAATRNRGANEASGDLLIFFDDDIEPMSDVIELIIQHHHNFPGSILNGLIRMDNRNLENDFYSYRNYIENKWESNLRKDTFHQITLDNYYFTSSMLSLPTSLFVSLKGFDERLLDSEDFDFCIRALRKGVPIWLNKSIFAWHRDFISFGKYIQRQKEYKKSRVHLAAIRPDFVKLNPQGFGLIQPLFGFKKIISFFFVYNSIWRFIINLRLIAVIPKKIRFRLYEIIIFSTVANSQSQ